MKTLLLVLLLLSAACHAERVDVPSLPALAAADDVTVSGLSAGAYMAAQYQVAHSQSVTGAALVAGGPWGCAGGDLRVALGSCLSGTAIDLDALESSARELAARGAIDPLAGLNDDRLWLFHGSADDVVAGEVVAAAADWYRRVAAGATLQVEANLAVAHGWPTIATGSACDRRASPWVYACDYDLAGRLLAHLYPDLAGPQPFVGELERFDQRPYAGDALADVGLLFVPDDCRDRDGCRVHVVFHGCGQSVSQVGDAFAGQAGFRRWAAGNRLILLFPQVQPTPPANPLGCWDWWGYGGADYLTQKAPQIAAVRAMLKRLQAARPGDSVRVSPEVSRY